MGKRGFIGTPGAKGHPGSAGPPGLTETKGSQGPKVRGSSAQMKI